MPTFIPAARYLLAPGSAKNAAKPTSFPAALSAAERRGLLRGPLAYARSRNALHGHVPPAVASGTVTEIETLAAGPVVRSDPR